jgi:hypothetical protein
MAIKPQVSEAEDAHEQGYIGTTYDPIENEAYTLEGQGEETAKREREATRELRAHWQDASVEGEGEAEPAKPAKSASKSSASSSSSGSSSS